MASSRGIVMGILLSNSEEVSARLDLDFAVH